MRKRFITHIGTVFFIISTLVIPVQAHHGGGTYWDFSKSVGPVTGTATKFSFNFPHITIYMDITDENGEAVNHAMSIRWTPTVLRKLGWSRKSVQPGDELTVVYTQHKKVPTHGALQSIEVNGVALVFPETESLPEDRR